MKIVALARDIPNGDPLPGVLATVTRQSDGVTVASGSTDVDGFVTLTSNGSPGNAYVDYLRGTDRFRDDSRAMRPFGAFSPALFQQAVVDAVGDGVIPYGDSFSITVGSSSITLGTGAAVLNGALGVWYTTTVVTVSSGDRACAVLYSGTGQLSLVDVAAADLSSNHLALYTYTVTGGSITNVTNVMTPLLEGIVAKKPTLQSVVRAATGNTSNSSGEASGNEITFTLASGRTYDIVAKASVISRGTAGAIAVQIDGNLSSYAANGADITTTISNAHTRSVVGGGSCTIRLYERSDTSLISTVNDLTYGSYGTGNDNFNFPQQVAVDSSGNVYVADYNNSRLKKHNSSGTFVANVATGVLYQTGVAVDASGNIYFTYVSAGLSYVASYTSAFAFRWVAGSIAGTIQHLATDGTYFYVSSLNVNRIVKYLCSTGAGVSFIGTGSGSGNGQLNIPVGVATDGTYLYVADYGNARVQKFTTAGVYVTKWGTSGTGDGQFQNPAGIAINPVTGNIFVTDTGREDIQEFTSTGTFVRVFATGLNNPTGVAVTSAGAVYTTDTGNNRIKRYTEIASSFTYDSAILSARAVPRS